MMMSLRMKLVHICLLFCLLFSLASFAFVGALSDESSHVGENRLGAWMIENDGGTGDWNQTIAWGGCQSTIGGTC
jgi:hypothetical protein